MELGSTWSRFQRKVHFDIFEAIDWNNLIVQRPFLKLE